MGFISFWISVYIVVFRAYNAVASQNNAVASHNNTEQCDLNNEDCFSNADKSNWQFHYVTSKQAYIDLISQGKSGLLNPYRVTDGLARRDGVKVGHVSTASFQGGRTVEVITRSMNPLLFEIPDFLTDTECDHIIHRAKDPNEGKMFQSIAKGGLTPEDIYKPTGKKGQSPGIFGDFSAWDSNKDDFISIEEMTVFIHASQAPIIMLENDINEMFKTLGMSEYLSDGGIDTKEFNNVDTIGIEDYVNIVAREHPRFKQRYSMQTWLSTEQTGNTEILRDYRERLVEISGLGREHIYGGENLQVVHYQPSGHYHAHYDTEAFPAGTVPCCHFKFPKKPPRCRLCRYLTFMMYLNNVEEGGETAFPIADHGPIDEMQIWNTIRGNSSTDKFNLSHGCKRANLVIKPRRGSALMWYNHLVNKEDGWMGERDLYSLHGGCDVIKGEKWISTTWIPAPFANDKGRPSLFLDWDELYQAETQATK